jgi:uncharacterized protein
MKAHQAVQAGTEGAGSTVLAALEERAGRFYLRQRLGIEDERNARRLAQGRDEPENWYSHAAAIKGVLVASGLYWLGRRNAAEVRVRRHRVSSPWLPRSFDGFTILHLSDLHVELSERALARVAELLPDLDYDLCALTGDYRAGTSGSFEPAIAGLRRLAQHLRAPSYGVLGNHDTLRMVPDMEALGIRMLLNEHATLTRGEARIYLAGVDDAHYFRTHNLERAAASIPADGFSILLSHTPEIYRQAAHAGFHLMLSGHTHGGQICLPGGIPVVLDADLPWRMGAGAWRYGALAGYTSAGTGTSIVDARFNCPPEITLHRLERRDA